MLKTHTHTHKLLRVKCVVLGCAFVGKFVDYKNLQSVTKERVFMYFVLIREQRMNICIYLCVFKSNSY